jgi:predicted permease
MKGRSVKSAGQSPFEHQPVGWAGWAASRLVAWIADEDARDDLLERFSDRCARDGRQRSQRWLRRQLFGFLVVVPAVRALQQVSSVFRVFGRSTGSGASGRSNVVHASATTWPESGIAHAWRTVRRQPRFAALLVTVLGTSLGTSAAVLSIVDAYLWRPLPYPGAERLVRFARSPGPRDIEPPRNVAALERRALLDEVADLVLEGDADGFTIVDGQTPRTVLGLWSTADVFPLFDIRPALGRVFTAEDVASHNAVVLISHALWTERYGRDAGIVGRSITLRSVERPEGSSFTVIGVLPPRYWPLDDRTAVIAPLWGSGDVYLFRLRSAFTVEQAATRLTAGVAAMNPSLDPRWTVSLSTLQAEHVAAVRPLLLAVAAAVILLVLIACSNLAMLQAVRGEARRPAAALMMALGASRSRLLFQLAVEQAILAVVSFTLACGIAQLVLSGVVPAVEAYIGRIVPGSGGPGLGSRVLVAMAVVTLMSTVGIGLLPWLRRAPGLVALKEHGRAEDSVQRKRLQRVGVVVQVAASLCLLVGASLLMKTAWRLSHTELGFEAARVTTASIVLEPRAYPGAAARRIAANRILTALEGQPEVETASLITGPAFGYRAPRAVFAGSRSDRDAPQAVVVGVTPSYFRALGIAIGPGRSLTTADVTSNGNVAVISSSLARRLWPEEDAVGRMLTTTSLRPMRDGVEVGRAADAVKTFRVVGISADLRRSLWRDAVPEVYVPLVDIPGPDLTVQVRGRRGVPHSVVAAAISRAVSTVDADVPVNGAEPLEATIARQGVRPRFLATILAAFAALAALGALVGLYATSAWIARQRRREAAIRLAIGAAPWQVVRLLTRSAAVCVAFGIFLGWWGSLALGRLLAGELVGVTGDDVATRVGVSAVLCVCCMVAAYGPVRAVTRASPAAILRE